MDASRLVLGVDGGGSKTAAWLARAPSSQVPDSRAWPIADSMLVGKAIAGGSNLRAGGGVAALRNLESAIDGAFADAGLRRGRLAAACLALAGVDREPERAVLRQWAEQRGLTERLLLVHDAMPILYAANPDGCGVALIAGTGSFAFGRNEAGETARAGGWGYLIGDEGSGWRIAVEGLQAAARCADGRGPQTTLLQRLLESWELDTSSQLIPILYDGAVDRAAIATRAEMVFDAAADGDEVANRILERAAGELAEMAETIARRLDLTSGLALAFAGGVLIAQPAFREMVGEQLAQRGVSVSRTQAIADSVRGAVWLASKEAREKQR